MKKVLIFAGTPAGSHQDGAGGARLAGGRQPVSGDPLRERPAQGNAGTGLRRFRPEARYRSGRDAPEQTLASLSARLFTAIDTLLAREIPDAILVQGDTTTAEVASLCAFYRRIPVGHVEAGLRSHDLEAPFPGGNESPRDFDCGALAFRADRAIETKSAGREGRRGLDLCHRQYSDRCTARNARTHPRKMYRRCRRRSKRCSRRKSPSC